MAKIRRALVLSGGGAKGSFQIGVLEHLILEKKLDFEIICGVSVGALNASYLAQAKFVKGNEQESFKNLEAAFRNLKDLWLNQIKGNDSIYSTRFGKYLGILLGADSIYEPGGLKKLLRQHIKAEQLNQSGRILKIGFVSLDSGEYKIADQSDPAIFEHVIASSTMPLFFPPVEINHEHLVDGGLRDITPLGSAFKEKPDEIYVVYASPFFLEKADLSDNWLGTRVSFLDFVKRSVEIIVDEVYQTDVRLAKMFNIIAVSWPLIKERIPSYVKESQEYKMLDSMRYCPIHEIKPEKYIIRDSLEFSPALIRKDYEHGKEVAAKIFP
jgi:NTE family protein